MQFAEVFLRLGASLVGWMIIIAYLLWLAVTPRIDCSVSGDELYRLLLYCGPPAALLGMMTRATAPMNDIQQILRWVGVFPAVLLPLALIAVYHAVQTIHVAGVPLCSAGDVPTWQLVFAPVVFVCLCVMVWTGVSNWRQK